MYGNTGTISDSNEVIINNRIEKGESNAIKLCNQAEFRFFQKILFVIAIIFFITTPIIIIAIVAVIISVSVTLGQFRVSPSSHETMFIIVSRWANKRGSPCVDDYNFKSTIIILKNTIIISCVEFENKFAVQWTSEILTSPWLTKSAFLCVT